MTGWVNAPLSPLPPPPVPHAELLLIGTGTKMENINPAMYAYFQRKGISVEVMPTVSGMVYARNVGACSCTSPCQTHATLHSPPVTLYPMQRHAMATFNDLAQEGRRVAAGLISISPVSRDEACMYTSDAVQTEEDRNMQKALARDYSAQEAVKLLEGATAEQKAEAQQLRQEMKEREQQQRKKYLEDSERLAVQYGYPGAQPPDAPLLLMSEAEKQERARASLRPRNAEELIDSIASKNSRRSSGAGGGGGKAS